MATRRPRTGAEVVVYRDLAQACAGAARLFVEDFRAAVRENGHFSVALSGGKTPKGFYSLLATPAYRAQLDWRKIHLFQADERCVPPRDRESNQRMIREILLSKINIPSKNVHWMIEKPNDWDRSAKNYEAILRKILKSPRGTPALDWILLGMGEDGHTASLFPGSAALGERKRLVVAHFVPKLDSWRITLTFPLINCAKSVVFLVSGKNKHEAFQMIFGSTGGVPAKNVRPASGKLKFLIDEDVIKRTSGRA